MSSLSTRSCKVISWPRVEIIVLPPRFVGAWREHGTPSPERSYPYKELHLRFLGPDVFSFGGQLERVLSVFSAFLLNPFMFLLGDMGLLNILFLLSILVDWKNFMRFLMSRFMLVSISFVWSVYSIGVSPNIFIRCSASIGQSSNMWSVRVLFRQVGICLLESRPVCLYIGHILDWVLVLGSEDVCLGCCGQRLS